MGQLPFTRVSFWVPMFDPQPYGNVGGCERMGLALKISWATGYWGVALCDVRNGKRSRGEQNMSPFGSFGVTQRPACIPPRKSFRCYRGGGGGNDGSGSPSRSWVLRKRLRKPPRRAIGGVYWATVRMPRFAQIPPSRLGVKNVSCLPTLKDPNVMPGQFDHEQPCLQQIFGGPLKLGASNRVAVLEVGYLIKPKDPSRPDKAASVL